MIWDEHLITPETLIDAGERVVVIQREYHRSKSGADVVADTGVVVDLHDGSVVRVQPYMDQAAALEAVGLSSESLLPQSRMRLNENE